MKYHQQLVELDLKVQMYEEGENSSSYFYNLERKNGQDKTWTSIKLQDGTYTSDISMILNEQRRFYKQLYTSEGCDEFSGNELLDKIENKLTNEEKDNIEGDIKENEIKSH